MLYARIAGRSPLECISYRLDAWVVRIAQQGSDQPSDAEASEVRVLGMRRAGADVILTYFARQAARALRG